MGDILRRDTECPFRESEDCRALMYDAALGTVVCSRDLILDTDFPCPAPIVGNEANP